MANAAHYPSHILILASTENVSVPTILLLLAL